MEGRPKCFWSIFRQKFVKDMLQMKEKTFFDLFFKKLLNRNIYIFLKSFYKSLTLKRPPLFKDLAKLHQLTPVMIMTMV